MSVSAASALLVLATPGALAAQVVPASDLPPAAIEAGQVPADEQGEIVVEGETQAPPGDPLARINVQTYEATQAVDEAVVAPVARSYEAALPGPARSGLRNFLRNLKAPIIALNFLLQLKPGKTFETIGRFTLNSTLGVGGLFDVAKREPFNLPHRPNGFADTLGYYGVGPGPYFFLPLIGPTTLRDLAGGGVDAMVLPTAIGGPFAKIEYTAPAVTVGALDARVQFNQQITAQQQADDPYAATREFYLAQRRAQIDALKGIMPQQSAGTISEAAPETVE